MIAYDDVLLDVWINNQSQWLLAGHYPTYLISCRPVEIKKEKVYKLNADSPSPADVMMYEVFLVTSQLEPLWSQSFSRIFFQTTAHNLLRYLFRQNFSQLSIQIQNVEGRKCLVRIEHKWEVETFNKSYQKMSKGSHLWFNSIKSLEESVILSSWGCRVKAG